MKKIMLSTVILLPIVVLLVLLVSSSIIGSTAHIYVDSVAFADEIKEIRLKLEDEENRPTYKLDVEIYPLNAQNKNLIFSSEDNNIVKVNDEGVVEAVDYGETYIKVASAENPVKSDRKKVIVYDDNVHRLEWSYTVDNLYIGKDAELEVKVIPKEAVNQQIVWKSDSPETVSVTQMGTVHASSKGSAVITAESAENPDVKIECVIKTKPVVTGIAFEKDGEPEYEVLEISYTDFPAVKLLPEGAEEKIVYSSSDETIATIDENGHIIFGGVGAVTFTASVDGNANIYITKRFNYNGGYYTLLRFSESVYEFDYEDYPGGSELPIELTGYPLDTHKDISISYSKEGVITTVKEEEDDASDVYNGAFYSVAPYDMGILVTATAEGADGKTVTASCFVYLTRDVVSINAPDSPVKAQDGICELKEILAIEPADYTSSLIYSVNDETTATVSEGGIVIFLRAGSVEVTIASAREPEKPLAVVTVESDVAFSEETNIKFSFEEEQKGEKLLTAAKEYKFDVIVEKGELSLCSADLTEESAFIPSQLKFDDSSITVEPPRDVSGGKLYECTLRFDGQGKKVLGAKITENGKIIAFKSVIIESTFGSAKEVSFKSDGRDVNDGENFVISDIGKSLTFTIAIEDAPEDFKMKAEDIRVDVVYNNSDSSYLYAVDTEEQNDAYTVRLTSVGPTYNAYAEVVLLAGGFEKKIAVTNKAPANAVEVYFGNTKLDTSVSYSAFTDDITLNLRATRTDGIRVTDGEISYQYDGKSGLTSNGGNVTISVVNGGELYAECGERNVSVSIGKADILSEFGLSVIAVAAGNRYEAAKIEKITDGGNALVVFPMSIQGVIALRIILPDYILGQLGEDSVMMSEIIEMNAPSSWVTEYVPELNEIILTPEKNPDGSVKSFDEKLTLKFDKKSFELGVMISDLRSIELTGYDIKDPNDVYKGLQQVGVYAKHSYYDGQEVDYFKIPFSAEGNVRLLQWIITEITGDEKQVVTTQKDRTIVYNGNTYVLNENGSLSDESGQVVASEGKNPQGITFIDPFTETGFARIWFGNVKGLTEEDISNDNFGDFDETGLYNTGNAPFVRIEATDGTPVINEHFNFNVAEDITAEDGKHNLVNVVDKYGFVVEKYIVLHTNLYGPEEHPDVDDSLVLDAFEDSEIVSELIYGNGYYINYRQRSLKAIENGLSFDKVSVGRVYNVTLKGTTASSDNNEYRLGFAATKQFYCIVQACKDGMYSDGADMYSKNTIYRYISESAIQLRAECKCIVENTIVVDCLKGLEMWYLGKDAEKGFFIRGFLDVINYRNENEPILSQDSAVNALKGPVIMELKKSGIEYVLRPDPTDKNPNEEKRKTLFWANIVMASSDTTRFDEENSAYDRLIHFGPDDVPNTVIPYGDKDYPFGNSYFADYNDGIYTWSLQRANNYYLATTMFDIAAYTYMNRKDISIDCQLLDGDRPNTLHLAWHMNRVYRSTELVGWHAEDHDENLVQSHANDYEDDESIE